MTAATFPELDALPKRKKRSPDMEVLLWWIAGTLGYVALGSLSCWLWHLVLERLRWWDWCVVFLFWPLLLPAGLALFPLVAMMLGLDHLTKSWRK